MQKTDIVPELKKKIDKAYQDLIENDESLKRLTKKIHEDGTWEDAQEYAGIFGSHRSTSFLENISSEDLPNGQMYYNIANRIIPPALKSDYEQVSEVCMEVQEQANETARIGIKAQKADLNQDRIDGIVNRISSEPFDVVFWLLGAPIQNFMRSVVDDHVEENADFQYEAGLKPVIRRTTDGKCCEWCSKLAGDHSYSPGMDREVFRRHENCGCLVAYYPDAKSKQYQNVHTRERYNGVEKFKDQQLVENMTGSSNGGETGGESRSNDDELKQKIAELLHPQKDPSKITIYGKYVETSELSFDNDHANEARNHGVTKTDADGFIKNACFSVSVWNGKFEKYYSDDGAAYVFFDKMIVRTAFKRDEFDEKVKSALEVFHEYKQ